MQEHSLEPSQAHLSFMQFVQLHFGLLQAILNYIIPLSLIAIFIMSQLIIDLMFVLLCSQEQLRPSFLDSLDLNYSLFRHTAQLNLPAI